jgi:hypothetical protein
MDLDRLRRHHPLQYGYRNGEIVYEPGDDATVVERYDRCPICEQWTPCDVRALVARVEELEIVLREVACRAKALKVDAESVTIHDHPSYMPNLVAHSTDSIRKLIVDVARVGENP